VPPGTAPRSSAGRGAHASGPAPRRLRDIGAEAVLVAGGGRAILLQLADPAVAEGVARHSDFAADPLRRLRATLAYVYGLVYGTPAQVDAVRRAVDAAHRPVVAAAERGRPAYDARDPGLQLWVAATLYDTAVQVHERVIGPLGAEDLDAIHRDYAVLGTALQMPAGSWPVDRAAFERYWSGRMATLEVGDAARAVAARLLHPRAAPPWLRVGMPLVRLVTAGLLPDSVRRGYGLPWSPARARRFRATMSLIAVVNRMLPRRIRELPMRRLLRTIRTPRHTH